MRDAGAGVGDGPGRSESSRRRAALHVGAAFGVTTTGVLPVFLVGAMFVQMRPELGFGNDALGVAVSAFFIASGLLSTQLGRLVQRRGVLAGIRLTACSSLAALLWIAFVAGSWTALVVALVVAGAGNGLAQPTANLALISGVGARRQGRVFGLKQASVPAAGLLSGAMVPVVALTLGWRWTFGLAALVPLSLLLGTRRLGAPARLAPPRAKPVPEGATAGGGQAWPGAAGNGSPRPNPTRRLSRLAAGAGLGSLVGNAGTAFLVPAAVAGGLSSARAGALLAAVSVVGLLMRVFAGVVGDRASVSRIPLAALLMVVGAAGFSLAGLGGLVGLMAGAFLAFSLGWSWPGLVHWEVSAGGVRNAASATGTLAMGIYLGAGTGPALFGLTASRWSYEAAWLGCAVTALASGALLYSGRPR